MEGSPKCLAWGKAVTVEEVLSTPSRPGLSLTLNRESGRDASNLWYHRVIDHATFFVHRHNLS